MAEITGMSKPLTVARQEFLDAQIQIINASGLPAFVVADVMTQVLASINKQIPQQYEADKKAYQEAIEAGYAEARRREAADQPQSKSAQPATKPQQNRR